MITARGFGRRSGAPPGRNEGCGASLNRRRFARPALDRTLNDLPHFRRWAGGSATPTGAPPAPNGVPMRAKNHPRWAVRRRIARAAESGAADTAARALFRPCRGKRARSAALPACRASAARAQPAAHRAAVLCRACSRWHACLENRPPGRLRIAPPSCDAVLDLRASSAFFQAPLQKMPTRCRYQIDVAS